MIDEAQCSSGSAVLASMVKMDNRFANFEAKFESKISSVETKIDTIGLKFDAKFDQVRSDISKANETSVRGEEQIKTLFNKLSQLDMERARKWEDYARQMAQFQAFLDNMERDSVARHHAPCNHVCQNEVNLAKMQEMVAEQRIMIERQGESIKHLKATLWGMAVLIAPTLFKFLFDLLTKIH